MIATAVEQLEYLCNIIPPLLTAINEETFSIKPAPGRWSKKEIIGHLIESATNNHHRFVRIQFEETPLIIYDQNKWNEYSFHHRISSRKLINFWEVYNRQLIELIKQITAENLQRLCFAGGNKPVTLDFLINDYVVHLEHHLRQVVSY